MMDEFLEIFKHSMHKLNLLRVKLVSEKKNKSERKYYVFIGEFEFVPPVFVFDLDLESSKKEILNSFINVDEQTSNCIRRKFTKKLRFNGEVKEKVEFVYVFDVIPKNIVDYKIDKEKQKMFLYVQGYGIQ